MQSWVDLKYNLHIPSDGCVSMALSIGISLGQETPPTTQHTRSSKLRWSLAHPAPPQPPRAQRAARRPGLRPPGLRRNGEPRHGVLERRGAAAVAVPLRGAGGATGGAAAVYWRTLEWQDEAMTGETGELVRNLGRFIGSIIVIY